MKTCLSTDSRTLDWVQFGSVTNNAVANTFVCVSGAFLLSMCIG